MVPILKIFARWSQAPPDLSLSPGRTDPQWWSKDICCTDLRRNWPIARRSSSSRESSSGPLGAEKELATAVGPACPRLWKRYTVDWYFKIIQNHILFKERTQMRERETKRERERTTTKRKRQKLDTCYILPHACLFLSHSRAKSNRHDCCYLSMCCTGAMWCHILR